MAITVQFIDEDWKLLNIPVAFVNITGPHTAKAIGEVVADKLSYFLGTYFLFLSIIVCVYSYKINLLSLGEKNQSFPSFLRILNL